MIVIRYIQHMEAHAKRTVSASHSGNARNVANTLKNDIVLVQITSAANSTARTAKYGPMLPAINAISDDHRTRSQDKHL